YRFDRIDVKLVKNSITISQDTKAICDLNVWVTLYDKYLNQPDAWQERILVYLVRENNTWKISFVSKYSLRTEEPLV
ncbi:MAG: hypothetical protein NZ601_01450, partial [candidate division WOR-3 bacterium]|nr:hypothetical protein [candidate division WOR-3 bacterium]